MASNIDRSAGICIRGVSAACTSDLLVQAFCGFGNIVDVFVKDMSGRRGRGYAFVTFADRSSVAAALEGAPASIGDDEVTVEARTPPRERKVAEPCENVYIKGIAEGTTEEQVQEAVGSFGVVVSTQVSGDRGFAFIAFETVEGATACVNAAPLFVGGQQTAAVEFRMSNASKKSGGGGSRKPRARKPRQRAKREPNSVYLKGVPAECTDEEIQQALVDFGTCLSVVHREGRDFAFAVFDSDAGMNAAVAAGSASVGGSDATIEERNSGN